MTDRALLDETRQHLADLVAFPTVSAGSNLELIAYVAERLGAVGAQVEITTSPEGIKANLFATIGPETDGGIILSGHTDVVPAEEPDWLSDPFTLHEADGRLYARGSADMKGFIAACLAVAPLFAETDLARPIHFAFTFDEEVGCLGGRQLVNELRQKPIRPALVIVGEPTEMGMIEGHKGCFEYTTVFTGLEGHGSEPEKGVNAVEYAVRYIARMLDIAESLKKDAPADNRFSPPHTTVQVGRIEGGTARNVIAGRCEVDWEMRPVRPDDADRLKAELADYCDTQLLPGMRAVHPEAGIHLETVGEVDGLMPVPHNKACALVSELTGNQGCEVVSFGTEAGLFQSLGIDAVICGPGSIAQAHKANEFVSLDQLQLCLDMLLGLRAKLSAAKG